MKFVSLMIAAMFLTLGADAQSANGKTVKTTVVKQQKKTKGKKVKSSHTKSTALKDSELIQLTDEKSYKAKWTFEEMLKRRLEIDAEDVETVTQNEKTNN